MSTSDQDNQLDELLEQLSRQQHAAPDYLAARIIANVPDENPAGTPLGSVLDWLTGSLWRGATAAVLPILLGFAIGFNAGAVNGDDSTSLDIEALVLADPFSASETGGDFYEEFNFDEI